MFGEKTFTALAISMSKYVYDWMLRGKYIYSRNCVIKKPITFDALVQRIKVKLE